MRSARVVVDASVVQMAEEFVILHVLMVRALFLVIIIVMG